MKGHRTTGLLLVECSFLHRLSSLDVLDIAGIWVPISCTPLHDIQGYVRPFATDGRIGGETIFTDSRECPENDTDAIMDFVQRAAASPVRQPGDEHVSRKWLGLYYSLALVGLSVLFLSFYFIVTSQIAHTSMVSNVCFVPKEYWHVEKRPAWYAGPDFYYQR